MNEIKIRPLDALSAGFFGAAGVFLFGIIGTFVVWIGIAILAAVGIAIAGSSSRAVSEYEAQLSTPKVEVQAEPIEKPVVKPIARPRPAVTKSAKPTPKKPAKPTSRVTYANYKRLKTDMLGAEVEDILGKPDDVSEYTVARQKMVTKVWRDDQGGSITVSFRDGLVTSLANWKLK